jgi:hypothetical protein
MFIKAAPIGASPALGKGAAAAVPSAFSAGNVDANWPVSGAASSWAKAPAVGNMPGT